MGGGGGQCEPLIYLIYQHRRLAVLLINIENQGCTSVLLELTI